MGLKFCPKCGGKLDSDTSFCNSCGTDLRERKKEKIPEQKIQPKIPKKEREKVKAPALRGNYADILPRLIAFLIDIIIVVIIGVCITFLLIFPILRGSPIMALGIAGLIDFVIAFCYFFFQEAYNEGQTLGKVILKLRTVDEKSLDLATPGQYLINNIIKGTIFLFIDLILGVILYLINEEDEKEKYQIRFTQTLSKTVVIKEE